MPPIASPRAPSRDDFRALASGANMVPVWREVVADLATPVSAFLRLVGDDAGFLLESVEHERWSRWTFLGRNPQATLISRGGQMTVEGELPIVVDPHGGMLNALERVLGHFKVPKIDGLPPLHGGLVGYLGYDVTREIEHLPNPPADDRDLPDAVMSVIGELAAFDHWRQRVTLVHNAVVGDSPTTQQLDQIYEKALAALDSLEADGARPCPEPPLTPPAQDPELPTCDRTMSSDEYCRKVELVRDHIESGDIFETIISQRFDLNLEVASFDVYRALRQINPSPYMFYLRHPSVTLVGSSPEMLVQVRDQRLTTRPIAGTRWRGRDLDHDNRLAAEMSSDEKERAEHVMILDLARNDLGRVAEPGSVTVDEMLAVERFSHVMHLASTVTGLLRRDCGPVDVIRATLPAGTVSGAPKVRAMQIIDANEVSRRGPYGGVAGYIDFSGSLDMAITLRTLVTRPDGRAWVQAGAGIVADSVARDEDLECSNKAAALLAAVATARAMRAPAP